MTVEQQLSVFYAVSEERLFFSELEDLSCNNLERRPLGLIWVGGSDIEASKCVPSQEAYCGDSVEGNGYPHTAQLRKLQSDMNTLYPKGGALSGDSLHSADTEGARIYPDLPA